MTAERRGILLVAAAALIWSTGGIGIKWLSEPPLKIAFYRSATAALALFVIFRPRTWRWTPAFLIGIGSYAACLTTYVFATKWTSAANAIFLVYTAPLYVALLSSWVLHEPIRRGDWLTLLLALLGLGCFCVEQLTLAGWVGNLCALGSGLATAWLVVCLRKATAAPLPILVLANLLVAIAGLPFLDVATLAPVHWGILLVAGVGQLGVSTVLYGKAIPHVRAIEAIMIPIMEPVLNPLWVWLLVGEVPSGWALLGGTMVVGAVTARGLTLVWHTPRADARTSHAA